MNLRRRLGCWLIRPTLIRQIERYHMAAERHRRDGDYPTAEHCDYIIIGLKHALENGYRTSEGQR